MTPSDQVLLQLNWTALHGLYCNALACMVFKCVHRLAPSLLANKFILHDEVAVRITRNANQFKLKPNICKTEFYKRSFVNTGAAYWNELPTEIRCSPNIMIFKSKFRSWWNGP